MVYMRSKQGLALIVVVIALVGITLSTSVVSAQSASGSFDPQAQFPTGSKITIRSVYGIATPRPQGGFQGGSGYTHNWNQSQNSPSYNASIIIDLQITSETSNGGLQFTVQGGVMVVNGSTIGISSGSGQISSSDRIFMEGTATSTDSQSINWHMNGLAAILNDAVVAELSGNTPITVNGAPTNVIATYIATIS
jgi:hypothetical protein